MSERHIVRYKKGMKDETDWARIRALSDRDIDFSDNPELDEKFWATAELVMPEQNTFVDVSLDSDVVSWFKKQGTDYQSKMSAVLKTYIKAQKALASHKQKSRKRAS